MILNIGSIPDIYRKRPIAQRKNLSSRTKPYRWWRWLRRFTQIKTRTKHGDTEARRN